MSEYTPDTLRRIARDVLNWRLVRINRGWLDEHARKLYDLVAAWEDDIAQREAQDKMMTSQDELNHNLVARIDVLERENAEWEASFALYNSAMHRGIKLWQDETGKLLMGKVLRAVDAWFKEETDLVRRGGPA